MNDDNLTQTNLGEHFFHNLSTIGIETVERNSILNKSKIEYVDWNCNPFVGCGHSCTYCYARKMDLQYKKVANKAEWHRPKLVNNYMELIEKKIHLVGTNEEIFLSTMTDIYAADTNNLGVARNIIKRFQQSGLKYRVLTKSSKIVNDRDIFENYENGLHGISITTNRDNLAAWKKWEPRTDRIIQRLIALKNLGEGYNVNLWVSAEPFLPGTNFEKYFDEIIGYSLESTLKEIVVGKMNYVKGTNLKFNWPSCVKWIEENRKLHFWVKWHYKKEFVNFLNKNYPKLKPDGGYP